MTHSNAHNIFTATHPDGTITSIGGPTIKVDSFEKRNIPVVDESASAAIIDLTIGEMPEPGFKTAEHIEGRE